MTSRELITYLKNLHESDDPIITAHRVLTELHEMNQVCESRAVKKAMRTLLNEISSSINKLEKTKTSSNEKPRISVL
jgi:hypothetical protein